jgi:hypothetical protein
MAAKLIKPDGHELTIQVTVNISSSMLNAEDNIQHAVNEVGCLATPQTLKQFDTDGSPIITGDIKWTKRTTSPKKYQTPYGEIEVERHVYQTSKGGKIYCPLEPHARIIWHATPRFARQLSHQYAEMNVNKVCNDLEDNHGRKIAASYVQNVADWVGSIASAKEEQWEYATPQLDSAVKTVAFSLDGAHIPIKDEGYRPAMVGTRSWYNHEAERLHTIYLGEAPEYGKSTFTQRMTTEMERVKALYPKALYLGIADGAADNWSLLEQHADKLLLDYFHASEYLPYLAQAAYPGKTDKPQRETWLEDRRHQLKHKPGFIDKLIEEAKRLLNKTSLSKTVRENLNKALIYFTNQRHRMDYAGFHADKLPLGSGVTEAACQVLVKQRWCGSRMRWKEKGARVVLSLRALSGSTGRWTQFWDKINSFGVLPC